MVDRLQMDSVYVLRVRGCNKAGFGEYSEEIYLHTPPAPGEICTTITLYYDCFYISFTTQTVHLAFITKCLLLQYFEFFQYCHGSID